MRRHLVCLALGLAVGAEVDGLAFGLLAGERLLCLAHPHELLSERLSALGAAALQHQVACAYSYCLTLLAQLLASAAAAEIVAQGHEEAIAIVELVLVQKLVRPLHDHFARRYRSLLLEIYRTASDCGCQSVLHHHPFIH